MTIRHWLSQWRLVSTGRLFRCGWQRCSRRAPQHAVWGAESQKVELLEARTCPALDFGDAPDTGNGTGTGNYQTLLSDSGPRHTIVAGLFLGGSVDGESDATPNSAANGDDTGTTDDEEGLIDPLSALTISANESSVFSFRVTNTTGTAATLYGWIDANINGVFETSERVLKAVSNGTNNGIVSLTFSANLMSGVSTTYARFRLSTDVAAAQPTGLANNGEVEDYRLQIYEKTDGVADSVKTKKIGNNLNGGPTLASLDRFGSSVANIGDLDGDGVTDLAVGAERDSTGGTNRGAIYIQFMNSNGAVKSFVKLADGSSGVPTLANGDFFGHAVAGLGDIDGDGVPDIAVGAYGDNTGGTNRGTVHVFRLNTDGSIKATAKIAHGNGGLSLGNYDYFGASIAAIGDLNGDGVGDIAVGDYGDNSGGTDRGGVQIVFLNPDGTASSSQEISHNSGNGPSLVDGDYFGWSVASLGDIDGDGLPDIAVGALHDDTGGTDRGAVHVLNLNADGTVKSKLKIASGMNGGPTVQDGALFGSAVSGVGDLDGDSIADLVVGAMEEDVGGNEHGGMYVLLRDTNGTVKSASHIAQGVNGGPTVSDGDRFGRTIAGLGDLNNDTTFDLAVGAFRDQSGGAVHMMFLQSLRAENFTVTESGGSTAVNESGTTDTFTVVLTAQPASDVVIKVTSSDTGEATVSTGTLTFTSSNWNTAQTVTITGVNDSILDGTQTSTITLSIDDVNSDNAYDPVADKTVSVTTADNEVAGFTITQSGGSTAVTEGGTTDTFTVVLNVQPVSNVVFNVSSSDTGEATVSAATLTFTTANWNTAQTVTITGVNDSILDGTQTSTITLSINDATSDDNFDPVTDKTVSVTTSDNDVAGFTIVESGGSTAVTEGGSTDTFTVVLSSQPASNVVINVSSSDTGEATVSAASLTFTAANWNTAQTVTVTGANDSILDGSQTSTITLSIDDANSDNNFDPLADKTVSVTTADNEVAGFTITQSGGSTAVSENGTTDTFTVVLDVQPVSNVVFNVSSSDTGEATVSAATLTFTAANWNTAQTVTVTGVNDSLLDGSQTSTIRLSINDAISDDNFDSVADKTVSVTTADNESAGVSVIQTGSSTSVDETGTTDTFDVVLTAQPTTNVVLTITNSDATEASINKTSLTFTSANWDVAQTVMVTGVGDVLDDGDQVSTITVSVNDASSDDYFDTLPDQTVSVTTIAVDSSTTRDIVMNSVTTDGKTMLFVQYQFLNFGAGQMSVRFLQSVDTSADIADTVLSTITITNPADLRVGSHTLNFTIGSQVKLPGAGMPEVSTDYFILAVADPDNTLSEADSSPLNDDNTVAFVGAYASSNSIYVHGGELGDAVTVTYSEQQIGNVTLDVVGSAIATYTYSSTARFRMRTHGGDDRVSVVNPNNLTTRPMLELGGDGQDLLNGAGSADTLNGGTGDDTLSGGSGNDLVDGGLGTNTLTESGHDSFVLTNTSLKGVGADTLANLQVANLTGGEGATTFTVSGWTHTGSINGGGGIDTIVASKTVGNVDFTLSDLSLQTTDGMNLSLSGIQDAKLTGGAGDNSFTVGDWTGKGKLTGGTGADTLFATRDYELTTLTKAALTTYGSTTAFGLLTLSGLEVARLTGGAKDNTFELSFWSGTGTVTGGGGSDTVVATRNANVTLTDTQLTLSTGLNIQLAGIGNANLTGGSSNNVFNVGAWRGTGTLSGLGGIDRLEATRNTDMTLTDTTFVSAGFGTLTLNSIDAANLIGGDGANKLIANEFTLGKVTLQGGNGDDVLIGGSNNDSLVGGTGRDLMIGGLGADTLGSALVPDGNLGDDLLISDSSTLSGDLAALNAIMAEWTSANDYATRVANLLNGGGANGSTRLDNTTVQSDPFPEKIIGGADFDWFFGSKSDLPSYFDVALGEILTLI